MENPNKSRVTIRDVYINYRDYKLGDELRGEWAAVFFYRVPAILITPLFLKFHVSATLVTGMSLVIVSCMPIAMLLPDVPALVCLGVLGVIFNILDCLDGNIARITGTASNTGRYLDFIADILQRVVMYLTLGMIIQGSDTPAALTGPLMLTVLASLLAVIARLSREYILPGLTGLENSSSGSGNQTGVTSAPVIGKIEQFVFSVISGLDTLTPILILVSALFADAGWLPWWLVIYSLLDFIYTQFSVIKKIA